MSVWRGQIFFLAKASRTKAPPSDQPTQNALFPPHASATGQSAPSYNQQPSSRQSMQWTASRSPPRAAYPSIKPCHMDESNDQPETRTMGARSAEPETPSHPLTKPSINPNTLLLYVLPYLHLRFEHQSRDNARQFDTHLIRNIPWISHQGRHWSASPSLAI